MHRGQAGVQYFAQGYGDMQIKPLTFKLVNVPLTHSHSVNNRVFLKFDLLDICGTLVAGNAETLDQKQ